MTVSFADADEILRIIEEFPAAEIRFEHRDLKLYIRRSAADGTVAQSNTAVVKQAADGAAPAVAPTQPASSSVAQFKQVNLQPNDIAIKSPMMGVFYRAPSPGAPPFVEVGQLVKAGTELCIIEVMKVMNTIKAPVEGVVTAIFAENEEMVARDAVLISIKP